MDLVKQNKNVQKEYNPDGTTKNETVNNISYQLKDGDKVIGSANIYNGGYSVNIQNQGKTIEELKLELETLFS